FITPVPPAAPALVSPANGAALPAGDFIPTFTWKAAVVPTGSAPVQHYHIQAARLSTFTSLDIDEYTLDASTTFTTLFNLTGNRTYYWRVRAFNTVGDYSPWSSVRTIKILPDKVASTWMTDTNTLEPGFGWTDPQCVGKYLVQIYKGTSQIKSATVTTGTACQGFYQLTSSLSLATAYTWRVTVQGATGNSLPVSNAFNSPTVVPGVPVLLGPANNEVIPDAAYSNWQPTLTWQAVTTGSPSYYEIQEASQLAFGSFIFEDDNIPNDSSITNPPSDQSVPLAFNTSVYWRARACDASNNCSVWSAARKLITRPGKPYNLIAGGETLDTSIQWADPGGKLANSYSVVIYSNSACTTPWKTLTSAVTSTHILLATGVSYCIKVRGVGPSASITGAYSDPLLFTAPNPPAAPALVAPANKAVISAASAFPSNSTPYQVNFSWNASPGAATYNLQVSEYSDFRSLDANVTQPATVNQLNFHSLNYFWRVRAGTGSGVWSAWSAVRSFSTLGQVWGYVQDLHSVALVGAHVTVSGVTGGEDTIAGGYYYLANLSTGAHTITITNAGYLPQTRTFTVAKGGYYYDRFYLPQENDTLGVYQIVLTWNPTILLEFTRSC
ncbi:MAG: carboxypeptidase regulatory-like domain-containing protein, partial [Anaerolineaceae bacterium]